MIYTHPFLAGILTTIGVEIIITIMLLILVSIGGEEDEN